MPFKNSIKEFSTSFCKEYDVNICHNKTIEFCPCRFKLRSIYFCNFNQFIMEFSQEKGSLKYKKFLKLICEKNRLELEGKDIISKDIQIRMKNAVNDIKNGRINVGDIVYCTKLGKEVILIEFPEGRHFDIYYKFGVFPGEVKCRTINGEITFVPIASINRISDGNYIANYEVRRKSKSSKKKVDYLVRMGKRRGFRVNITETEGYYKLEFFGDTQKEVYEFVELCNHAKFY